MLALAVLETFFQFFEGRLVSSNFSQFVELFLFNLKIINMNVHNYTNKIT